MTAAVRLRHTNRTGLRHLSVAGPWRDGDAPPFGFHERTRAPRPAPSVVPAPRPRAALRRSGRHDLLPVGPGQAVCSDCGCVFELHAYVEGGRRLPLCRAA